MDPFLTQFTIFGVSLIVLIPFVVNALKQLGLPPQYGGYVAVGLGLGLSTLAQAMVQWPGTVPWVTAIVGGLLVGLGSVGSYALHASYQKSALQKALVQQAGGLVLMTSDNPHAGSDVSSTGNTVIAPIPTPSSSNTTAADPNTPGL